MSKPYAILADGLKQNQVARPARPKPCAPTTSLAVAMAKASLPGVCPATDRFFFEIVPRKGSCGFGAPSPAIWLAANIATRATGSVAGGYRRRPLGYFAKERDGALCKAKASTLSLARG